MDKSFFFVVIAKNYRYIIYFLCKIKHCTTFLIFIKLEVLGRCQGKLQFEGKKIELQF